jgi:hypothetical protein
MTPRPVACAFGVILAVTAAPVASQAPSDPVDAVLAVRLAAGKSTYAVGELIPLELEFRGQAEPDWYFATRNYDPSGRMITEQYVITPIPGVADPLAEYYASFGGPGGGLGGWQPLDGHPFLLSVDLNDWVRFTRPGDYRLVVTSHRLERHSGRPAPELVSRPVALHIEPARPEWATAEASRAIEAIESGQWDALRRGIAILRHLGTREAALALVRFYGAGGTGSSFEAFAGLAGLVASPYRKDVVEAMESRIDAGDPLPARFVRDLALVRSLLDGPAGATEMAAHECDYTRRWSRAITRREPTPEALTALLAARAESSDDGCEAPVADALAGHPAAARAAFLALPASTQESLLQSRWTTLDRGWIQPALETLLVGWNGDSRFPGAGDWALQRLVEIDPPKGRSLLLQEIRTGAHGLAPDTLTSLVDEPLPDVDGALLGRYEAARSDEARAATMWLVARYGSPSLASFVRAQIEHGSFCALEAAALVYLLRHDPEAAIHRLQPGFDRSGRGMCVIAPWQEIAPRYWDQRLEDAAVAHLRGREPDRISSAAQILQAHGSARTKEPLLDRLIQWEAEWHGRETELDSMAFLGDSPAGIENALVNALLLNDRITLTPQDIDRIRSLCVTGSCRTNVEGLICHRGCPTS